MRIVELPIGDIAEVDELWWFQDVTELPTPRAILEHTKQLMNAKLAWPILLDPDRRLLDGMHRVLKAMYESHAHIEARILPKLPTPDFVDVMPGELPY